ncbi:hypothetical protein [Spirillospora sp. CA-294931]|uniref:hypothetical protein n=1 Tax=Spirillospora sp. CA-294931 TaxID=3240042 RepID=UPI003D8F7938
MLRELAELVTGMARREARCGLLTPPFVATGREGPSVRVRLVGCRLCGARDEARVWPAPMRADDGAPGPVLSMLACESLTARAVLPIVTAAEHFPELRDARFTTRALTWAALSHLAPEDALARVDAAERWVNGPDESPGRTLPASTRPHRPGAAWPGYRAALAPRFLTPHPALPSWLDIQYEAERRSVLLQRFEGA